MNTPDPSQVLQTATEPAVLGPLTRWLRTVLQVVLAVAAAVPSAAALFDLPAATSAKVTAIAGALVIVVSAIQNAINVKRAPVALTFSEGRIRRDRGLVDVTTVLLVVLLVIVIIIALNHL